jgi:hypothetical protein
MYNPLVCPHLYGGMFAKKPVQGYGRAPRCLARRWVRPVVLGGAPLYSLVSTKRQRHGSPRLWEFLHAKSTIVWRERVESGEDGEPRRRSAPSRDGEPAGKGAGGSRRGGEQEEVATLAPPAREVATSLVSGAREGVPTCIPRRSPAG